MSDVVLGKLPEERASRDAIHVAVIPVEAGVRLRPGQRVGIKDGKAYKSQTVGKVLGIVDPYLLDNVEKGETFWLALLPGTVTGMRHHWLHPDFEEEKVTEEDDGVEERLRELCDRFNIDLAEAVSGNEPILTGDYINVGQYESIVDDWEDHKREFASLLAAYTGEPVDPNSFGGFSCAC